MAKQSKIVDKYESIHFAVPKGASPNDYKDSKHQISMKLAMDMCTIKSKTKNANQFHKMCFLYYKDREKMVVQDRANKHKNDAWLESHRMTLLTIHGECITEACDLLNMSYSDTKLDIDVYYKGEDIAGAVQLSVNQNVPEHKAKALHTIFNEFQKKAGGVKKSKDVETIEDAEYKDMVNTHNDENVAKA